MIFGQIKWHVKLTDIRQTVDGGLTAKPCWTLDRLKTTSQARTGGDDVTYSSVWRRHDVAAHGLARLRRPTEPLQSPLTVGVALLAVR